MMYEFTQLCCEEPSADKPLPDGRGYSWNILERNVSRLVLICSIGDAYAHQWPECHALHFKGVINIDNKMEHDYSSLDDGINSNISNYYSKAIRHLMMRRRGSLGLTIAGDA